MTIKQLTLGILAVLFIGLNIYCLIEIITLGFYNTSLFIIFLIIFEFCVLLSVIISFIELLLLEINWNKKIF